VGARTDIAWACEQGVPIIAGHDYQSELHHCVVRAVDERFAGRIDVIGSVWIAAGPSGPRRPSLAA
jgi:hypothetical protein